MIKSKLLTFQRKQQKNLSSLVLATCLGTSLLAFCGCSQSPEAMKKARTETLEKFAKEATEHLLDKNPETIKVSVNQLMHQEVHTNSIESLQKKKILPDSSIDVLKAIDDAQRAKRSNKVQINSVKPLSSLEKEDVSFQIRGQEQILVNGKTTSTKPFTIELKCRLTDEMNNYPQIIDVNGMVSYAPPQQDGKDSTSGGRKKRRRG
jgi:hypothetical protein